VLSAVFDFAGMSNIIGFLAFRRQEGGPDMKKAVVVVICAFALGFAAFAQEGPPQTPRQEKPDPTLTLKIGDPKLRDKTMEVAPGAVLAAGRGSVVGFEAMIREMDSSRFVYVGETHNSMPTHDIQFEVLRALYSRDRHLAVAMEMLPVTVQETLNKWSSGLLTREEFLREVRWYVHWNFHFGYYEKIFEFAKEHRLPVYALNIPREIITKIRMGGWESLSDEEKAFIPEAPEVTNEDHRTLIRTIFESMDMPQQMKGPGLDQVFEGLYRSQSAWDEVMGANTIRGFAREGRRMVVLAGSGHLVYNLGLNRRAYGRMNAPFKTVVAVVVPEGRKSVTVSRSYGDYVIGLAPEAGPAYPSAGLAFQKVENLDNLVIEAKPRDGAAARADFEKGDVVLSVDGKEYADINELRMSLATAAKGGKVIFRVLRAGTVKEVVLIFEERTPDL
jgi:uncharacterized iron-regulated protein